ncbi:TetR/AcrR family transcriptional regulator [Corynebacterium striatum]|uniref:TetR/AcrR family transcriptional regulator n=1 Tax=Corynebacterium striatum TaxID=43770 RepID=A0ABX7DEM7_CORST|nr:TetR/AcrR family transcriptional regulator [Corynebacterium striatum]QQU76100.1 TetR/AcrR family transcriptional regulator [Corynebacterium striatum]
MAAKGKVEESGDGAQPGAEHKKAERKKAGRRPGALEAREKILEAACMRFSEVGFEATTIRAVAKEADVDPALVMHYFKNKDGLFDAVIADLKMLPAQLGASTDHRGFIANYLRLWESEDMGPRLRAVVRGGIGSSHASAILRESIMDSFVTALLETEFAQSTISEGNLLGKIAYLGPILIGTAIARYVVEVPLMTEKSIDDIVEDMYPAIETLLSNQG